MKNIWRADPLVWGNGPRVLAELRRFEHFEEPKYLNLLEPAPKGRHYSGVGGAVAADFGGWLGGQLQSQFLQ